MDYRYDQNGFFNNPEARTAMEAVAARWSRIIDQSLMAVNSIDDDTDRRFMLINPSTGKKVEVSSAARRSSDDLHKAGAPAADEYWNGISLPADVWVLFVGARNMSSLALGGAFGGGTNFETVFDEAGNLLNRGFNSGAGSLSVLGGNISFNSGVDWHFKCREAPSIGKVDFYSVALHEMGHCFGMASTGVIEWSDLIDGGNYTGANAVAAYSEDLEVGATTLAIAGGEARFDYHWKDGEVTSKIFLLGEPNLNSTVGVDQLQEALMSSSFQVSGGVQRRELTNVDVGAVKDLGWSVITEKSLMIPLSIIMNSTGQWVLEFQSKVGQDYRVQTSVDLNTWADVTPHVSGKAGSTIWQTGDSGFNDPNMLSGSGSSGFFRVLLN
ncbi:hypothetical protein V2O64_03195 [Verrucomicrobiaceae bacterium 227]